MIESDVYGQAHEPQQTPKSIAHGRHPYATMQSYVNQFGGSIMNETTQRRSSRTVRFLMVAAVLFGIATTTYVYLLPKKITSPRLGITFEIPSPAAISWHSMGIEGSDHIFYVSIRRWRLGDAPPPPISERERLIVTNAVCDSEQMPATCTHDEVFDYLVHDELTGGANGRYSDKILVYLIPVGLDDFMYSTTKDGCGGSWCAYRWRLGDQPLYIRISGSKMPIEHESCDVSVRELKIDSGGNGEIFFIKTYASIQCDGAHVVMDISNTPEDEIEPIIASVAVLE